MKILVTIPCLLTGGTEIQTLNLVRALVKGGTSGDNCLLFRAYRKYGEAV